MARYTSQTDVSFGSLVDSRTMIVNGSVAIYVYDGSDWILSDTIATGSVELFTKNTRFRFTPDAGSSFWIDETRGK